MKTAVSLRRVDSVRSETNNNSNHSLQLNKTLNNDLKYAKKQLNEAECELDMMKMKSKEMESLVSVISRSWSQLDVVISLMLDTLGESEFLEQFRECSDSIQLLNKLLHISCSNSILVENKKSNEENNNNDDADEDDDEDEDENEMNIEENDNKNVDDDNGLNIEIKQFEEDLVGHTQFTLTALDRLCMLISEGANPNPDPTNISDEIKHLKEDNEHFLERIQHLAIELLEARAAWHLIDQDTIKLERKYDIKQNATSNIDDSTKDNETTNRGENINEKTISDDYADIVKRNDIAIKDLKEKMTVLETNLNELESAKVKAEMKLTDRLAKPLQQTEASVADLRNALEDLRSQCKTRVSSLIEERNANRERILSLEASLQAMDNEISLKCNEVVSVASTKVQEIRSKIVETKSSMVSTHANLHTIDEFSLFTNENQILEAVSQKEIQKVKSRIIQSNQKVELIKSSIDLSQKRIEKLNNFLLSIGTKTTENTIASTGGEEGEIDEMVSDACDMSTSKFLQVYAEHRNSSLQQLLEDVKTFINDSLITDIEDINTLQASSSDQQKRVQMLISNAENNQKEALDENLLLQEKLISTQNELTELERKLNLNSLQAQMQQQDTLIDQFRLSDVNSRGDMHTIKKARIDNQDKHGDNEEKSSQNFQKLGILEHSIEEAKNRNTQLKLRFEELKLLDDRERNLISKIESNREARLKHKREKEGSTLNKDDKAMLDMSLGMLRCSICDDRFKDVVISKCMHLFCKVCIEQKLTTKQRKCSICSEKFSKADIKAVYFTH